MKKIVLTILLILNVILIQAQSPWLATNTPLAGRYDDMFFVNKDTGWAVGTGPGPLPYNGLLIHTTDGGANWSTQQTFSCYVRSVEFSSPKRGFLGGLGPGQNFFFKTLDGGNTWTDISSVVTNTNSKGICGICSIDTNVTYAVGVYASPAYVIKTVDGGNTWVNIDMSSYASRLIDVQFTDANNGYVTGQSNISSEGAVILKTTDGGVSWVKVFTSNSAGDYLWKIQNLDGVHWFGSIQKPFVQGWNRIVKSVDSGNNWSFKNVDSIQWGDRFQVVGFIDSLIGWAGGSYLYQTHDGGNNWALVDSTDSQFDRFQRINSGLADVTGQKVYKLQDGWVGIKEQNKATRSSVLPELKIFPNPVKNNFTIELFLPVRTMYNLRIISVAGNTVVWDEVGQKEIAGKYEFKINQKLVAGEYFVYVMTNEGATSKKLIIVD